MDTLYSIQDKARFYGVDDTMVLTSGTGLVIANNLYRALAAMFPWPEFRRTTDLPASTTSGTGKYNWISTPVYTDIKAFEVGKDATDSEFALQISPISELRWNLASKKTNRIPTTYMRYNDSGTEKVEIRPAPNYTGATMRVTGTTQATEFVNGNSQTEFLISLADDALSNIIAAAFLRNKGANESVIKANIQRATDILKGLFKNEPVTIETTRILSGV